MPLPSRSTHNGVLPPRQNSPNSTYPVNITVLAPPTQGNITYTTNLTHAYNESDLTSIDVPLTETVVVGGPSASATTTVVFHIGNSTSDSGSGMNLQPAIPALGAVLGVVIVISVILVGLLLRKNKQLFRAAKEARESALSDPSESNYPLASKELDVVSQEDSPAQLKRQLAEVRQELAAVTVLTPSTIRDQSDYVRDLTLLNDNIRQLSMRINRARPDVPAAVLRTRICAALWSAVFARFDAGLDGDTERHMSSIMSQFKKPSEPAPALVSRRRSTTDYLPRHRCALEGHDGAESTARQPRISCAHSRAEPGGFHRWRRPARPDRGGCRAVTGPLPSCD